MRDKNAILLLSCSINSKSIKKSRKGTKNIGNNKGDGVDQWPRAAYSKLLGSALTCVAAPLGV